MFALCFLRCVCGIMGDVSGARGGTLVAFREVGDNDADADADADTDLASGPLSLSLSSSSAPSAAGVDAGTLSDESWLLVCLSGSPRRIADSG